MAAGIYLAALIGPSVASALMAYSPWIPLSIGVTIMAMGAFIILFVPETLHLHPLTSSGLIPDSSSERNTSSERSTFFTAMRAQVSSSLGTLRESASIINLPIVVLLVAFVAQPFIISSTILMPRYISKKFSWEMAHIGYLLSVHSLVNLLLLLVILPSISYLLAKRYKYSPRAKDLFLALTSAVFGVVGVVLFGVSSTIGITITGLVITTLGGGYQSLCRSLITSMVDKEHVARLYSLIAVIETATLLAAGPIVGVLFSLGMKWKGPYLGLPYLLIAVIWFCGGLAVWTFGFLTRGMDDYREDEEPTVNNVDGDTLPVSEDLVLPAEPVRKSMGLSHLTTL